MINVISLYCGESSLAILFIYLTLSAAECFEIRIVFMLSCHLCFAVRLT